MRFFIGLLLIVGGLAIIRYRYHIQNFGGNWGWAETYVGGTVNAIVIIGAIMIFAGVGYPFGVFDDISIQNATSNSLEGLGGREK